MSHTNAYPLQQQPPASLKKPDHRRNDLGRRMHDHRPPLAKNNQQ